MIQHFVIEQSTSLVLFLSHDVLLSSVQSLSYAECSLVYWFTVCFVLPDLFGPSFLVSADTSLNIQNKMEVKVVASLLFLGLISTALGRVCI